MKEEWKDIPGYEGLYQVSTYGRVKSLSRYVRYGKDSEKFIAGRIRKQRKNKAGYQTLSLYKDSKPKTHSVHTLVLTAFHRPPRPEEECNHKDGDKSNNCIENLEWCTAKENHWHKNNVLGKHQRGESHHGSKLTDQEVIEIRVHLKEGKLTQQQIAERYNVSEGTISMIKSGKLWKHINKGEKL